MNPIILACDYVIAKLESPNDPPKYSIPGEWLLNTLMNFMNNDAHKVQLLCEGLIDMEDYCHEAERE